MADRSVLVRLRANASDFNRGMASARASLKGLRDEIDTTNDRTAWLAQSILGLGPALAPLGAGAVPVLSGLATQMTVAGTAAVTAGLAFNGVGDALGALNDFQVKPTAENLVKLEEAMAKVGPAGEQFVRFLDEIGPEFSKLSNIAREGMFPGVQEGITSFLDLMPKVQSITAEVATGMGELAAKSGEALSGTRFEAFFDYLESDAKPILLDMGRTAGGFADGLANMMVAFGPVTEQFSSGFADMATDFAEWSRSLDDNASFQEFLDYVQDSGPKALDFLGSLIDAFAELIGAAAPVGDVLLPLFGHLLDVVAALADTPLGPMFIAAAAAMSLYGRAAAVASITTGGLGKALFGARDGTLGFKQAMTTARPSLQQFGLALGYVAHSNDTLVKSMGSTSRMASSTAARAAEARLAVRDFGRTVGPVAGQVGLLALAGSGVAEKFGLANTASLALAGSLVAPGLGTALGATAGLLLDARSAGEGLADAIEEVGRAVRSGDLERAVAALEAAKGEMSDINDASGLGDFFSDIGKSRGASVLGLIPGAKVTKDEVEAAKEAVEELRREKRKLDEDAREQAALDLLADGLEATAAGADAATDSTEEFIEGVEDMNRRLSKRAGLRDYQDSLRDFREALEGSGDAIKDANEKIEDAERSKAAAQRGVRDALERVGDVRGDKKSTPRQLRDANEALADARRNLADAEQQRREAVADAEKIRGDATDAVVNGRRFDRTTEAGSNLEEKFDRIAESALKAAETMDAVDRVKFLDKARQGLINAAREAGFTRRAARRLADELIGLDQLRPTPKVVLLGINKAISEAQRLKDIMSQIHGAGPDFNRRRGLPGGPVRAFAEGGTVPGPRYPYGDKIIAAVAPGEEIITNRRGEADRFRADRAAGRIPAYANGGTVGTRVYNSTAPGIDYDRLAGAVLAARPLYGEVKLQPHNYSEFTRQMEQDRRMSAYDGMPR